MQQRILRTCTPRCRPRGEESTTRSDDGDEREEGLVDVEAFVDLVLSLSLSKEQAEARMCVGCVPVVCC